MIMKRKYYLGRDNLEGVVDDPTGLRLGEAEIGEVVDGGVNLPLPSPVPWSHHPPPSSTTV
jgi:hypothetical protein